MLQQNVGKNIAILFYARALDVIKRVSVVVFICGFCSTALTTKIFAAAKMPPQKKAAAVAAPVSKTITLENLKPFTRLALIRTNVDNNAFETLTLTPKQAVLTRSVGGFQKTLALEEGFFETLEQNIRALKTYDVKKVAPVNGLKAELEIAAQDAKERVEIDTVGTLKPLYTQLMDLRNRMLTDAK